MKKAITISIITIIGLAIIYFLILRPMGVLQSKESLVKKQIIKIKEALPETWGNNDSGYSREVMVRRKAVHELLIEGILSPKDLTEETRSCLDIKMAEAQQSATWMEHIQTQVDEGKYNTIEKGIFANASWSCYNGSGEYDIK